MRKRTRAPITRRVRRTGTRPALLKVDASVQRWSASLGEELATWPDVSSRPMFGLSAFYRGNVIFAALPKTRAATTASSILIKLKGVKGKRLQAGGPGAGWVTFALEAEEDLGAALDWLGKAYEAVGKRR